jgi:chitin-binding protein
LSIAELTGMVSRLIIRPAKSAQLTAPAGPASRLVPGPGRHHAEPDDAPPPPPEPRRLRPSPGWLTLAVIVAAFALALTVGLVWTSGQTPSGTVVGPASRGFACRPGGTEHDRSAACLAAAAVRPVDSDEDGGIGDGTDVGIPDVAGRHQQVIPDGRLCSAGRERFRGLDLPRADWPATEIPSGGTTILRFQLEDSESGTLRFFLTLPHFDPTAPLAWSMLDPTPIATVTGKPGRDDVYRVPVKLPERTGRQLLYTIWEQGDGKAALYSCSDLIFGGEAGSDETKPVAQVRASLAATPTASAAPTPTPTPTEVAVSRTAARSAASSADGEDEHAEWEAGVRYHEGDVVEYDGSSYRCLQGHISMSGWEPDSAEALWEPVD